LNCLVQEPVEECVKSGEKKKWKLTLKITLIRELTGIQENTLNEMLYRQGSCQKTLSQLGRFSSAFAYRFCHPTVSSSGALSTEKPWTCWSRPRGRHKNDQMIMRKGRESWGC